MQRLYASSNGYKDELAWAAAWLFRATGEARFRNDAKKYYNQVHHMLRLSCRLYCVRLESLPLKSKTCLHVWLSLPAMAIRCP